ncbi:uncharacterized protein LOC135122286 isoform X2 [Zophobas morio]|uniref:uncharacterized protein LOC135122286 isoform X2 n=1 Tax=Zophobas morio TaxID=2755281 RepID=UPI00308315C8
MLDNVIMSSSDLNVLKLAKQHLEDTECWQVDLVRPIEEIVFEYVPCSRYEISDSDEEPFQSNATDEEYEPTSEVSEESDENGETSEHTKSQLQTCKKRLFEGEGQSSSSSSMPTTSNRNEDFDLMFTPLVSPVEESNCRISAHLTIYIKKCFVSMKIHTVLHEGHYVCDACSGDDNTISGFLYSGLPATDHKCNKLSDKNRTLVLLSRNFGEREIQVKVRYCLPVGKLIGEELPIEEERKFITPLIMDCGSSALVNPLTSKTKGKRHCCYFYEQFFVEMSSHILRKHKDQEEVKNIMTMKANSVERNAALREIRRKGDYNFNKNATCEEKISIRRVVTRQASNLITCPNCFGEIMTRNFARHERKCTGRPPNRRNVLKEARFKIIQKEFTANSFSQKLFLAFLEPVQVGLILHEILEDKCLKLVAERYSLMHRGSYSALKNDRQHLRRMARLILDVKDINPSILDFEDLILYGGYDALLEGVFNLCSLDKETDALNVDYLTHNLPTQCEERGRFDNFKTLHDKNYGIYVGRSAGRTSLQRKAAKLHNLPKAKDVKLFSTLIVSEAEQAYQRLQDGFDFDTWLKLGKAALARVIVYNRRRVSEVASMSLELYNKKIELDDEILQSLPMYQRELANKYKVMTLIGKRLHILHVLLDENQCRYLDMFLQYRKEAGVPYSNNYLFGIPTRAMFIDASVVLRDYSEKCGAEEPHLLRSTYLRKQVATLSQLLTMNDNEIGQIAKLMGHSQKVHEQVYRQDELLFQLTGWAKFLTIVDGEELFSYRGKSLDEILTIAQDLPVPEEDPALDDHITSEELLGDNLSLDSFETTCSTESTINRMETNLMQEVSTDTQVSQSGVIECYTTDNITEVPSDRRKCDKVTHTTQEALSEKVGARASTEDRRIETPKKKISSHRGTLNTKSPKSQKSPRKTTIAEIKQKLQITPVKRRGKKPFTSEQMSLMQRHFSQYISRGHLAPPKLCAEFVETNQLFSDRSGRDVYNWIQYQRTKRR